MADRLYWSSLEPAMRAELLEILAAARAAQPPLAHRFYNDSDGFHAFMLMAFLVSAGGAITGFYLWATAYEPMRLSDAVAWLFRNPVSFVRFGAEAAAVFFLSPLALWIAFVWLSNLHRRGLALTRDAVVVVRGPRLRVVHLADIAHASQKRIGPGNRSFAELRLTRKDGGPDVVLWTRDRRWATLVEQRIATSQPVAT